MILAWLSRSNRMRVWNYEKLADVSFLKPPVLWHYLVMIYNAFE